MKNQPKISILSILFILLATLVLAACQTDSATVVSTAPESPSQPTEKPISNNPTVESYEFAKSKDGYITLHGLLVVLNPTSILPGKDDAIFLVPMDSSGAGVTGIPEFTIGEVPQADVDESTGEFVFLDIQPGKYAVVVTAMGGAQIPTRKMVDGTFAIFTFTAEDENQIIELGSLSVP